MQCWRCIDPDEHTGTRAVPHSVMPQCPGTRSSWRVVALAVTCTLVPSACGEVPVRESRLESTLAARTTGIIAGQTARPAVRELLGVPLLSSDYWRFDVFRAADTYSAVLVLIIPVWYASDDLNGYVLVDYDERGTVAAVNHGFASDGTMVDATAATDTSIRAGEARLWASAKQEAAFVAVGASRRDAYLGSHPPGERCRLLVGCPTDACPAQITLDGTALLTIPDTAARLLPAVAPFDLKPGGHRLDVVPPHWYLSFAASVELSCRAGETSYAMIDFRSDEPPASSGLKRKLPVRVTASADMPAEFREHALVVYADGQWLVPQEPGGQ